MNKNIIQTQGTISVFAQETNLLIWIEAFLIDRKAKNLSAGTLDFYQKKLKLFMNYCKAQVLLDVTQITPNNIRQFLLYLEELDIIRVISTPAAEQSKRFYDGGRTKLNWRIGRIPSAK